MTPRETWAAINLLSKATLIMHTFGVFKVDQPNVRIADGAIRSQPVGRGATPEEAIVAHFTALTRLGPNEIVTLKAPSMEKPLFFKWSGTHWAPIKARLYAV